MVPLPYIAGFFDGEGSIGVYPDGNEKGHTLSRRWNMDEPTYRFLSKLKSQYTPKEEVDDFLDILRFYGYDKEVAA